MSLHDILELFNRTLQADQNIRTEAENTLKNLEKSPNILSLILELIVSPEVQEAIKLSASVYLKNRIKKAWAYQEYLREVIFIHEQDKAFIKQNILKALPNSKENIREILSTAVYFILQDEYPKGWPNFIPEVNNSIRSEDPNLLHCGLLCLRQLFKVSSRKGKKSNEPVALLADNTYPQLLNICNKYLNQDSDEAAVLVRLCLKIYREGTRVVLTKTQQGNAIVEWGNVFIKTVEKVVPNEMLPNNVEDRETLPWVKTRKWGVNCLNLLFARYGNPNSMTPKGKYYKFANQFVKHFAPNIFNSYIEQFYNHLDNKTWMSDKVLIRIIDFFCESLQHKITWNLLKPHTERIVRDLIFPNVGFNVNDEDSWSDNPSQFINQRLERNRDQNSLTEACLYLLDDMVKERKKFTFVGILDFVYTILNKHINTTTTNQGFNDKDAAFAILECIHDDIIEANSKVRKQAENALEIFILPELSSPNHYLRFRACTLVHLLSDMEFSDESLAERCYSKVNAMLNDPFIHNQVIAALSIGKLINYDSVVKMVDNDVPLIMEKLLILTNQVDVEPLSMVIENLVETFKEKLIPFSFQLCQSLISTLNRLFNEMDTYDKELVGVENDKLESEYNDKVYNASGIVRTLTSLIYGLDGKLDILNSLDEMIAGVLFYIFNNSKMILYEEAFELADGLIYSIKTVSPNMWKVYEVVHQLVLSDELDYLSECSHFIDSLITCSLDTLNQNDPLLEKVFTTCSTLITSEVAEEYEQLRGSRLLILLVLNLPQRSEVLFPPILKCAFQLLMQHDKIKHFKLLNSLILLVVACLATNFTYTLSLLEKENWTSGFFTLWFQQFDKMEVVHDLKLCILALCNIIKFPYDQLPNSIKGGWPQLLNGISLNFKALPEAEKKRQEAMDEITQGLEEVNPDDVSATADNGNYEDDDEENDDNELSAEDLEQIQSMVAEARGGQSEGEESYSDYDNESFLDEEDVMEAEPSKSPIIALDPYILFQDTFVYIQNQDSTAFSQLTQSVSDEAKAVLEHVLNQANLNRAENNAVN